LTKLSFAGGSGGYAFIRRSDSPGSAGKVYTASVWLRTLSGTATIDALCELSFSRWARFTVTSTWQRFEWRMNSNNIRLGRWTAQGTYADFTVYAFGFQYELGPVATTYAKTTTAAMSAMANKGEARGDTKPLVSNAGARVIGYSSGGVFTPLQLGVTNYGMYFGGAGPTSATVAALAGRWSVGRSKWDQLANTMTVYADGQAGTPAAPGGLVYPVDFMTLGYGGGQALNGYLRSVKIGRKR
jgi:hypothetical protein